MADKIPLLISRAGVLSQWDVVRVTLNLSGCFLQVGAGFLDQLGVGRGIGASSPYTVKAQPAGVAFSIWAIIFLACIGYGIFQALPAQRTRELFRDIGFYSALALWSTILWELIAILAAPADNDQRGYIIYEWILSTILFSGIAFPLSYILFVLLQKQGDATATHSRTVLSSDYVFVVFPVSVFAAWTTVASFLNAAGALCASGVSNFNVATAGEGGSVAYLCSIGIVIAALIFASEGNIAYSLVFVWAYAWIAQVNFASHFDDVAVTAVVFVGLFMACLLGSKWRASRSAVATDAVVGAAKDGL